MTCQCAQIHHASPQRFCKSKYGFRSSKYALHTQISERCNMQQTFSEYSKYGPKNNANPRTPLPTCSCEQDCHMWGSWNIVGSLFSDRKIKCKHTHEFTNVDAKYFDHRGMIQCTILGSIWTAWGPAEAQTEGSPHAPHWLSTPNHTSKSLARVICRDCYRSLPK